MIIPDKAKEILDHEGVVAIVTQGKEGPHLVNSWNSYVRTSETGTILIPVGGMTATEENLRNDARVLASFGSREVPGLNGPGAGFLITGTGKITASGANYENTRQQFSWARAVLEIAVTSATQTI